MGRGPAIEAGEEKKVQLEKDVEQHKAGLGRSRGR